MLSGLPLQKKNLGAPLQSRKAMLETLFRHLDMVRLSAAAGLMLVLVSCTGLIDGGGGGGGGNTQQSTQALALWNNNAYPILKLNCMSCHANNNAQAPAFLALNDPAASRTTLLASDVVDLDAPGSSRILTKGFHNGPALLPGDISTLLGWLQAEKDAQAVDPTTTDPLLSTPAFAVMVCPSGTATASCPLNTVLMSQLGTAAKDFMDANITFIAQNVGGSLYLNEINVNGGTNGFYFEHPLFVSRDAKNNPIPDEIDRYFDVKLDAKGGTATLLDGGAALFNGFDPTDKLEIHFKTVTDYKPDTSTTTVTGCKVVTSFTTNVAPTLKTNCASCHGAAGNSAVPNMDLTKLNSTVAADIQSTCNEVLSKVNLTTPANSAILLTPNPANKTNHPFNFGGNATTYNTFATALNTWITAEKTAP